MKYEALYIAYLIYFNRDRDYFECHEVLEELWLEKNKDPLYKGLLQVAVGLYHFRNRNVTGGRKMLYSAVDKLDHYPSDELGINLSKIREEARAYAEALDNYDADPFVYYDLDIEVLDSDLEQAIQVMSLEISPNIPQRRGPQRGAKHEGRK